ncbi:MAG: exodeoxyribonuclease V subunit gamma [Gammaproteobacteria bacterium]|nr:exodeoxyribonuclease V subunit gamma [Gammaproteobacteria bacterium]
MKLFTGNRLEVLLDALHLTLSKPLPVLQKEIIVVQSQGMERWISMQLAKRFGVWANGEFPFPRAMAWNIFRLALADIPEVSAFEPAYMTWMIARLLPDCLERREFSGLQRYLDDDPKGLKRYQLAQRIAHTFDQYVIYRPEMIRAWEQDEDEEKHWQAVLWRALRELLREEMPEHTHRAALREQLFERLSKGFPDETEETNPLAGMKRISVFGISALPPFYMEIFAAIAKYVEVNLFIMNPCQDYWGDIVSDTEISRRISKKTADSEESGLETSAETLYLETGNALLASMGKLGRDFLDMLNDYDPEDFPGFAEPGEETLLTSLQTDILHLREPEEPIKISAADNSIQIHACHGPLREIEVLHDRLLALFDTDKQLKPHHILVMAPDIETYAPLIQAVFDALPNPRQKIPFSIADRSVRRESPAIDAFLAILALKDQRATVTQVMNILEAPAVRQKFEFSQGDVELARHWLEQARVRWGADENERRDAGLPPFRENTWEFGLERLLLGYAMSIGKTHNEEERLFQGILPLQGIEGNDSAVLGKLMEFSERLFSTRRLLAQPRDPRGWHEQLSQILNDFFRIDAAGEIRSVQWVLTQLIKDGAGFEEAVDLDVIRSWLEERLEAEQAPVGFITGNVTFCAMLPMRSIPFKVICLLGMNDRVYPRSHKPPGFDLMAANPKRGDRSRRNDDRYLFLESLLSARTHLYLSYAGQSIQDNSEYPPSVLISELLDYICRYYRLDEGEGNILEHLRVKHPLQPFSPRYFIPPADEESEPSRLFSYSREQQALSAKLAGERKPPGAFFTQALPAPEPEWRSVELDQLIAFYRNPCAFLLSARLGIRLDAGMEILEEREPLAISGLEKYLLDQTLTEEDLADRDLREYYPIAKASGQLPPGNIGKTLYHYRTRDAENFTKKIKPLLVGNPLEALDETLELGEFRLHGRIQNLWPAGLVHYRPATVKPKDLLAGWIHHLFLNAAAPDAYPKNSFFLGSDKTHAFPPLGNSREILANLLACYWEGLQTPLHFFPKSAFAYAQALKKGKSAEEAMSRACAQWFGGAWLAGECEDPYYLLCFRDTNPLDPAFVHLAETVFFRFPATFFSAGRGL